ncbi:SpoIVB peptidase [Bacillaceae bacterium S4-13-58]
MKKINHNFIRYSFGSLLLLSILLLPFISPVAQYLSIPTEITVLKSDKPIAMEFGESRSVYASSSVIKFDQDSQEIKPNEVGSGSLVYEAAGVPAKKVDVRVVEDIKVIPGGQSIGVKLNTTGVLIVGHHKVSDGQKSFSPGEEAGIKVGDMILKINGQKVESMDEVGPIVQKFKQKDGPLDVEVKRNDEIFTTQLTPIFDEKDQKYQLGLYIRDSAAGIGTMTFYEPKSKKYGALGHVISDMDTKKPIDINKGTIVESNVTSIKKGSNGVPGEKQAEFSIKADRIGSVTRNSPFGIFGVLDEEVTNGISDKALPIALSHQVKEGPAKILTVVDGEKVEEFDVEIVSSIPQKHPATKGMIVKITDEELLQKTGGIVQGMSGSPIIQDGKVIGAITHVFVNDPTSGYGVHIEWMLNEAGINIYKNEQKAS